VLMGIGLGGVIPSQWGWSLGGGCAPSQKIFLYIFSFKMVHSDVFWSTFYTNCNCHYDVHDINSNILKLHMFNSAAKTQTQKIMCRLFWGGVG